MKRSWNASPARRNSLAEGGMLQSVCGGWRLSAAPGLREGKAPAQGCTARLLMTEMPLAIVSGAWTLSCSPQGAVKVFKVGDSLCIFKKSFAFSERGTSRVAHT